MQLRNYQEEIVLALIPLVLEDRASDASDVPFVHDVAAYVLNRLPPRYIMSERGLTRIAAEQWLLDAEEAPERSRDREDPALVGMVQLLILINKAVQVVDSRRHSSPRRKAPATKTKPSIEADGSLWHSFPQIVGRLVDARAKAPVLGATVTLTAGKLGVLPSERGWSNPCQTNNGTKGYFSLWPRAFQHEAVTRTLTLRFTVEHPDYEPCEREVKYRSHGEIIGGGELRLDRVINLGTQALTRRRERRGPGRNGATA